MQRFVLLGSRLCVAVLVLTCLGFVPSLAQEVPLIPRDVLFGNPEKSSPEISPDGTQIAYLAPNEDNVLNVWLQTIGQDETRMVTNDTHRGIRIHFWAEDGKHLIYLQDIGGNEVWHVYSVDLETDVVRDLTPFQGIRAQNILTDKHHPDEILVGLNLRDRRVFDMYRINLATGAIALDTENPGDVLGWGTDPNFQIRAASVMDQATGGSRLRVRDTVDAPWRDLVVWPFGEEGDFIDFTADGKAVYVETTLDGDTGRLALIDVATGQELKVIAVDPRCDLGGVMIDPDKHEIQAVRFNYTMREWKILDESIKQDFAELAKLSEGEFFIVSRDRDDLTWIVATMVDDGPVSWYSFDRKNRKATFLFSNRTDLDNFTLAKMKPVVIEARDGMKLVSYLTLPPGSSGKNLPLVLNVHGGPWARDSWGLNPETQWLANRGYAVLQVNFRGSTGFGKKHLHAGDLEWGVGKMQHDLTDAVKWAIAEGIADPDKVCIYGWSYGGYATLAGLVFTPDLYACGVNGVGPSNIQTLFASIPPYWAPLKKMFTMRVGDVENDEELNRKISPLFHVDNIQAPLLIGQGANDPRVNIREADQIFEAMKAKNLPVEYIVYTDEGHGFARPPNRLDFYGRAEEFLAKHLGGRAQPWAEITGASVEVR
jgi:dipeptidyl aminopeptidase/acylaminoacyl peptidase